MLPDARLFVNQMLKHNGRIHSVVNFEPLYKTNPTSTLDVFRNKYIEVNGYCKNIEQALRQYEGQWVNIERDFFGMNPLFPESRIEWRPYYLPPIALNNGN